MEIVAGLAGRIAAAGTDANRLGPKGPYCMSQSVEELEFFCSWLHTMRASIDSYLELGIGSGGMARFMTEEFNIQKLCLIDNRSHPLTHMVDGNLNHLPPGTETSCYWGSSHGKNAELFLKGRMFDLILVDGDHTKEGVRQDVELVLPCLHDGSILALHDTVGDPGVVAFLDEWDPPSFLAQAGHYSAKQKDNLPFGLPGISWWEARL